MWLLSCTLFPFPPSLSSLGQCLNLLNMSSRSRPIRRTRPAYEVAKVQAKAIPQELIDTAFQPTAIGKQYSAQLLAAHTNIDPFRSETKTNYSRLRSHLIFSGWQSTRRLRPMVRSSLESSLAKSPHLQTRQTSIHRSVDGWLGKSPTQSCRA
jgi:hypothetical protein